MMKPILPLAAVLVSFATANAAATHPIVVELFTSQGCSSCPPADRLLTELAGRPDLLPLAFHVTYWNALGWRDPYSFEGATERQAQYAERLGGGSYTPEMVVDGRRAFVGSERGEAADAIAAARQSGGLSLRVTRSGGDIVVAIGAGPNRGRILLVGFDPHHETAIGRGENAGRTLTESNVVRSLKDIGRYDGVPATFSAVPGAGTAAAILVQGADGRILGAARL